MNFFIHFLKELKKTGAVAPSSKFLARDLVEQLQRQTIEEPFEPLNILEIGAGTGSLTNEIAKNLRPSDTLDIVELQKDFYEVIQKKFSGENISVYHTDIINFTPFIKYDFVFSSLPYENMSAELCKSIWDKKLALCEHQAYICYFKYISFRGIKNAFQQSVVQKFGCEEKVVLRNLPPAKLFTLQINTSNPLVAAEI
ncbi:MAG TPA: rRNA adenine N-6-methyltransferase family protein [Balneolaceae bacterium]|nr:rRNA adenine N-6-methyltransferase family protein [Balneolaceae bacterium]